MENERSLGKFVLLLSTTGIEIRVVGIEITVLGSSHSNLKVMYGVFFTALIVLRSHSRGMGNFNAACSLDCTEMNESVDTMAYSNPDTN